MGDVKMTDVHGDDCVYNFRRTSFDPLLSEEDKKHIFKRCSINYQNSWQSSIDKIITDIKNRSQNSFHQMNLKFDSDEDKELHSFTSEKKTEMMKGTIKNYEEKKKKVIGFGHSMGGAMMYIAATQRPDLFKRIIVWDPPMFNMFHRILMAIIPTLFPPIMQRHPLIKSTYRKKQMFTSKEEAMEYFSSRRLFSKFSSSTLEKLI